jgi:hypothetical protein
MIGFEKDFLCHFHLGLIWISLLFSFLSTPFCMYGNPLFRYWWTVAQKGTYGGGWLKMILGGVQNLS